MPIAPPVAARYQLIDCRVCGLPADKHVPLLSTSVRHRGRFMGDQLQVVACPGCGVVFLNPQAKPGEYTGFYAEEYYQLNWPSEPQQRQENVNLLNHETQDFLGRFFEVRSLAALTAQPNPTVVDIGAGYGAGIEFLLRNRMTTPERLAAIEPSHEAAAYLRQTFGIDARAELLESSSFDDGQFDMAISLALVEHLQNPLEGLKAANCLLKPDGLLLLATPCLDAHILAKRGETWFKIVHTYYFTPSSLSRLLQMAGFDCVACETHPSAVAEYNTLVALARKRSAPLLYLADQTQIMEEIDMLQLILQNKSPVQATPAVKGSGLRAAIRRMLRQETH